MLEEVRLALADRYAIERELGKGGMGTVLLARDLTLQRPVAIKVLPPEMAARPELRERFLRETQTAAGFSHPNIVSVHAVEERGAMLCFVMAFVDGETLTQRVRRAGPLGPAEASKLLQEVAWALSYAHGRGVIHRDIKPDNILMERATGRALVTDFGIARTTTPSGLTQVGEVIGTPQFMSPEQAAGEPLDGRSDLYSLGIVAFFAVTGRLPFESDSTQALLAMQITRIPPTIASLRPDLPNALAASIDKLLAKNPADRFASGEELAAEHDALRLAQPEVAPAIRVYHERASQAIRAVIILSLMLVVVWPKDFDNADRVIMCVFLIAFMWGFAIQLIGRTRYLLRQGFTWADVKGGSLAIAAEGESARAQIRAVPAEYKRWRQVLRGAFVTAAIGAFNLYYAMTHMRFVKPDGGFRVSRPGIVMISASVAMIALAFVAIMTSPLRGSPIEKLEQLLWSGPFGRLLFRLAAWKLPLNSAAGSMMASTGHTARGPLTALDGLDGIVRKSLSGARAGIERIEQRVEELGRRESELARALREAETVPVAGLAEGVDPRRNAILDELAETRKQTAEQRQLLIQGLEHIRLQLLRLRTGLGKVEEVAAEVAGVEKLGT
ncbi:MAG: serine/threonine-protein kinase [Gemmatimonadota bacterium]